MEVSPPLQVQCFGGFHVRLGEEPITAFNTDKVRALFIYLVVEKGNFFQRSHLAGLLWSDIPEEQALHNLRQAISLLRKAIREVDQTIIYADREQVGIQKNAHLTADILEFSQLIQEAFRFYQNQHGLGTINIVALRKALQVYKNPFLDRYHLNVSPLFDEWLLITREKYDSLAVEGLAYLAGYYERRNEKTNAIQVLRKIIHISPWDENAHYQLIDFLAQDGQWSAAQKQYASLIHYLKNDLNVTPDPKTEALFERVRTHTLSSTPTSNHIKTINNLPLSHSIFVGREGEIDKLSEMIADPMIRLVNILGLGGIGKTRLVLEIASYQVGVFHHGVFLIALRNVESFDGFLSTIGEALRMKFSDQTAKNQQIIDYCRQKQMLLLLDNLDSLASNHQVRTLLSEIVEHCKQVMVLTTSRQKINIVEETVFRLDGLKYQDEEQPAEKEIKQSDSCLLFKQRVQSSHQDFEITPENQDTIHKLCKLVEGHPLAIELVAGSVTGKIEQRIEETIEQGMGAFVSALANTQQHHKTLAAVFDLSWQRLTGQEQTDLSRLSVFKGGFEEKSVYEAFQIDAHSLTSLIDNSLLRVNLQGRYDLHEIVRQFSEQKCKQTGEWERVIAVFSQYFFSFLQNQLACFREGDQTSCLENIERELDNIYVAWDWFLNSNQFSVIADVIEVLYQFFSIRSRFLQGIEWLEILRSKIEGQPEYKMLYAMVLNRIGSLAYKARHNELARNDLYTCYDLLTTQDNKYELAFCLIGLGSIELRSKNYQKALEHATQSLRLYREVQDVSGEAYASYLKGLILNRLAEYDQAEVALQHSLSLAREINNKRRMVAPLNLLGDIACIRGEYKKAELIFQEGLEIATRLGDRFNQAILLNNLATVSHYSQEYARERKVLLESLAICEEIGDLDGIAIAYNNLCEVSMVEANINEAIQFAEKGLQIAQQIGEEWTITISLNNLGEAYLALNQLEQAMNYFKEAVSLAKEIDSMDIVARISVNIGHVLMVEGKSDLGCEWLQACIQNSAIEFDHQRKAIQILENYQMSPMTCQNDDLLEGLVTAYIEN